MAPQSKTTRIKTLLAWLTSVLLVTAAWTLQFQIKPLAVVLVIGISGTLMIFGAEFVYSYRKRRRIKFGSIRNWLRLHITFGIAGPLLILWHTGFNFYGFAGWLALLTGVVVLSGFIGRYIYRQIPRSIKGRDLCLKEIQARIDEINEKINLQLEELPRARETIQTIRSKFPLLKSENVNISPEAERSSNWRLMLRLSVDWYLGRFKIRGNSPEHHQLKEIEVLELKRLGLIRQIRVLKTSKSLMAKWKLMHVPLTLTLFTGILIHVVGLFYYGKLTP